jgi:hypothetical protein
VEVTVREMLDLLLWNEQSGSFDLTRLPPSASNELVALYQNNGNGNDFSSSSSSSSASGKEWFDLLSDMPGCHYLSSSPNGKQYELTPTLANVTQVSRQLLFPQTTTNEEWTSLEDLSTAWNTTTTTDTATATATGSNHNKLQVSFQKLTHRTAMSDLLLLHEIATLYVQGSNHAIEMRLDKANGICSVTHLRLQETDLDSGRIDNFRSSIEHRNLAAVAAAAAAADQPSALYTLALALVGDRGLLLVPLQKEDTSLGLSSSSSDSSSSSLVLDLLSTPFGSDRRGLMHVAMTSDLAREANAHKKALVESQQVLVAAMSKIICKLNNTVDDDNINNDPALLLYAQLLLWILTESPHVVEQQQQGTSQLQQHDSEMEAKLLSLPMNVLTDETIQKGLELNCWACRGKVLTRLIQLKSGDATFLDIFKELGARELWSLVSMYMANYKRYSQL